jgi:hypothetical protein
MGYTKRQYIEGAFEELGMADYVFDMTPEEFQGASRRLDAMMAFWNLKGIQIGYPGVSSPENTDIDVQTGIANGATEAIITNLAIRIAPSYGKTPSEDTKATAKTSFETLALAASLPVQVQWPGTMPMGAGNRWWGNRYPFYPQPIDQGISPPDSGVPFEQ